MDFCFLVIRTYFQVLLYLYKVYKKKTIDQVYSFRGIKKKGLNGRVEDGDNDDIKGEVSGKYDQ